MKLRRVKVENVRSFLNPEELRLEGDISIIIGPNGGGKTNLLDTISIALRRHLLISWISVPVENQGFKQDLRINDSFRTPFEQHSLGIGKEQRIEIELQVTVEDIENMIQIKNSFFKIQSLVSQKYSSFPLQFIENWEINSFLKDERIVYTILNNALHLNGNETKSHESFRQYLYHFDALSIFMNDLNEMPLSMPMILMPVNRVSNNFQQNISLANHDESNYKKSSDMANSRAPSALFTFAIGRLARKYRLLLEQDTGNAKDEFRNNSSYAGVKNSSTSLNSIGIPRLT